MTSPCAGSTPRRAVARVRWPPTSATTRDQRFGDSSPRTTEHHSAWGRLHYETTDLANKSVLSWTLYYGVRCILITPQYRVARVRRPPTTRGRRVGNSFLRTTKHHSARRGFLRNNDLASNISTPRQMYLDSSARGRSSSAIHFRELEEQSTQRGRTRRYQSVLPWTLHSFKPMLDAGLVEHRAEPKWFKQKAEVRDVFLGTNKVSTLENNPSVAVVRYCYYHWKSCTVSAGYERRNTK